ncbi:L-threonine O-3-phosphate decarboxylase [Caminicella sporogenes DSM 14501]|uniref:threonine-phosphate decarboxylase n=1 Tax=Caminicella sporogenes DSM 14501 TaxID=1121266 RepID=A0A1M6MTQ8_9FIRM|nr:threonine-phosphate decarboxylase CobD [Caminicella sporogenes]RKD22503.1 threonine-phosphate decarboxylase [Caminicella sporogenes]SHJ86861.1 L-threonine O-3-phosphate decarboxylase [Caminicella sporogenes DSM 14501]
MKIKHGGNIYEIAKKHSKNIDEIIDFSANINPLGISKKLREAIIENIDIISKYPDPDYKELIKAIADYNFIDREYIIPANGATEIIFLMIEAIRPKKALLLAPTFLEYERALKKVGSEVIYFKLEEDKDFKVEPLSFINKITDDINLIILCNPNNPTGQIIEKENLIKILKKCKEENIYLMIDEAFIEFVDEEKLSMVNYVEKFDNLLIVKALTKFFAIPGLRLGYGIISNKILKEKIDSIAQPWTINSFASLAGKILLEDKDYIYKSKVLIKEERKYLLKSLNEFREIKIFNSKANYIFFKLLKEGINLREKLIEKNILIRQCDNYINLDKCYYRVAVKDRNSNKKLIKALREVLYEG